MRKAVILVFFLLSACSSVRNDAEAYATRNESDIQVAIAQQELQLQQQLNNIAVQEAVRQQEIKEDIQDTTTVITKVVLWTGGVGIALAILSMSVGFSLASVQSGRAAGKKALLRSTLIYADPSTGLFPVKVISNEEKVRSLADMNKRTLMLPDQPLNPDPLMVASSASVQHAGVVSRNASKANGNSSVTDVTPLVIDVREHKDA